MRARNIVIWVIGFTLAAAAPAAAQTPLTAPGRVVMPTLGWEIAPNPDAGGGGLSVGLPDGSALVLADFDGHGRALHRLRRDGTFELRGPLQLPDEVRAAPAHNIALDPQGRVLVSFQQRRPEPSFEFERVLVVRLTQAGEVDTGFGTQGVADPGINLGCAGCADLAAAADGSVLLTGSTGGAPGPTPGEPGPRAWVVARLTPSGLRDAAFDGDGIAALPPQSAAGFNVAPLPDGRVAALGQESVKDGARLLLARLLPDGRRDPAYADDGVATTPFFSGFEWLVRPDGTVYLSGFRRAGTPTTPPIDELTEIARFTPGGTLDRAFDGDGLATIGSASALELYDEADGVVLVLAHHTGAYGTVTDIRVGPDGAVSASGRRITPSFGGGIQGGSLAQNSLHIGRVHRRPDGSFLVTGGLSTVVYTGEGEGRSVGGGAYASLTPQLLPETTFGGPARTPRLRTSLPRQRAATVRRLKRIRIRVDAARPSLVELTVRSRGTLLARGTVAVLQAGPRTHTLLIARSRLARVRPGQVEIDARVRDLVGTTRRFVTTGGLR